MVDWFARIAPIRVKFRVILTLHAAFYAICLACAALAWAMPGSL